MKNGTEAAVSSVRWCTAAAPAVRRHCDTSELARWCAGATPAARRPASSQCWLKIFSQTTTGGPLRRHDGGSRFPLNMELEPAAVARRRVHYATRLWPSSWSHDTHAPPPHTPPPHSCMHVFLLRKTRKRCTIKIVESTFNLECFIFEDKF